MIAPLLMIALRSAIPVAAGLAVCVLLRHRSAALRHRVLTVAAVAAAVVVPLSCVLPSWDVPLPAAAAVRGGARRRPGHAG